MYESRRCEAADGGWIANCPVCLEEVFIDARDVPGTPEDHDIIAQCGCCGQPVHTPDGELVYV